jgi:hypothetical protein
MGIRNQSGQAIVETVLTLPMLILLLLNTINFGYLFISVINMTSATRAGTGYAVMGSSNTVSRSLPAAGDQNDIKSVAYLVYQDIRSGMSNPSQLAAVRVCTPANGYQNPTQVPPQKIAVCQSYGNMPPGYSPPLLLGNGEDNDFECPGTLPNCPVFSLARVDIFYLYRPLIPGLAVNAALTGIQTCQFAADISCTFVRTAKMRVMGS